MMNPYIQYMLAKTRHLELMEEAERRRLAQLSSRPEEAPASRIRARAMALGAVTLGVLLLITFA